MRDFFYLCWMVVVHSYFTVVWFFYKLVNVFLLLKVPLAFFIPFFNFVVDFYTFVLLQYCLFSFFCFLNVARRVQGGSSNTCPSHASFFNFPAALSVLTFNVPVVVMFFPWNLVVGAPVAYLSPLSCCEVKEMDIDMG